MDRQGVGQKFLRGHAIGYGLFSKSLLQKIIKNLKLNEKIIIKIMKNLKLNKKVALLKNNKLSQVSLLSLKELNMIHSE